MSFMSSFFRNPNDVTESEDQTYDEDDESSSENELTHEDAVSPLKTPSSKALRKVETLDSTTSTTNPGQLSRQLTAEDGVKSETKEWLMRALLEEKCFNDALADFEARNKSSIPYTKDHPEVRALADAKYEHMVDMLSRASILPAGPERRDSASRAIKQQARDGLDYLSTTSPQPGRPGVMHRDSSLLSLHSGLRDLIVAQSSTRAVNQVPLYQQEAMNRSLEAVMGLPPLLRPLVDHPMFEMSRYLRDFIEVRMVGRGGYGKVYHVQHRLDGSDYAVKKINLNAHRLKRIQERGQIELDALFKELRMLAKFDHPNIVRYYGGWLEYSSATPFPSPAPNGKLMIEAGPVGSDVDTSAGAVRSEIDDFLRFETSSHTVPSSRKRSSVDILFERSGGEILGDLDEMDEQDDLVTELQPQIKAQRKRANSSSTTASGRSKLSSVHSVGADDDDVEDIDRDLQVMRTSDSASISDTGLSSTDDIPKLEHKPDVGSVLTLHIQMALHPLSLADYLAPGPVQETLSKSARHCFHIKPSLQILLAILDGVQYLHDNGVVHRDLKPSNVFLTLNTSRTPACIDMSKCSLCRSSRDAEAGRKGFLGARIGDFGLVTEIARASPVASHEVAASSKVVGTELYRPPTISADTQINLASSSSEKLDVYSLGIILAELLVPFGTRMERQQTLVDVRAGQWDDTVLVLRHGELGKALHALVEGMTLRDESQRMTCETVRDHIERLMLKAG